MRRLTVLTMTLSLLACQGPSDDLETGTTTETEKPPQEDVGTPDEPDEGEPITDPGDPQMTILEPPATIPEPLAEIPPVLRRKAFDCRPELVGAEAVLAPIAGTDDVVIIRAGDAAADCKYSVVYRGADGSEDVLSESDDSYFLTVAMPVGDDRVVCISTMQSEAAEELGVNEISTVPILCATRLGGAWSKLAPAIEGNEEWAAWVREIKQVAPDTFELTYARDFSFQFMNMSDVGRPASDGVYAVTMTLTDTGFDVSAPTKITDAQNPLAVQGGDEPAKWQPTEEELEALKGIIE